MSQLSPSARHARLQDVAAAIRDGQCFTDLAAKWNMTVSPTWLWCHRNVSASDRRQLAMNGNRRVGRNGRYGFPGKRAEAA